MSQFTFLLAAGLAGAFLWLLRLNLMAARTRKAARAGYFSAAAGLFQDVVLRVEPTGFARMAGTWAGARFDLQAVPDTLTFRKLPALWVMVTLTEAVPVGTELHIMARPTQTEVFSHFGLMPVAVALPAGFPDDCALRCEDAAGLPPLTLISGLAALFADERVKELVISPKGVRLVVLAEEAERGAYLLFRDAEMGRVPFAAARLLPHLDVLRQLRDDLRAGMEKNDV